MASVPPVPRVAAVLVVASIWGAAIGCESAREVEVEMVLRRGLCSSDACGDAISGTGLIYSSDGDEFTSAVDRTLYSEARTSSGTLVLFEVDFQGSRVEDVRYRELLRAKVVYVGNVDPTFRATSDGWNFDLDISDGSLLRGDITVEGGTIRVLGVPDIEEVARINGTVEVQGGCGGDVDIDGRAPPDVPPAPPPLPPSPGPSEPTDPEASVSETSGCSGDSVEDEDSGGGCAGDDSDDSGGGCSGDDSADSDGTGCGGDSSDGGGGCGGDSSDGGGGCGGDSGSDGCSGDGCDSTGRTAFTLRAACGSFRFTWPLWVVAVINRVMRWRCGRRYRAERA